MENGTVTILTKEYKDLITDKVTAELTLKMTLDKLNEASETIKDLNSNITVEKYYAKQKDERIRDLELRLSHYEVVDKVETTEADDDF